MSDFRMTASWSRWRFLSFALFPLVVSLAELSGCAAGEVNSAATAAPTRPLYRPGQSLDARLCECRECFARACCSGEPETPAVDSEVELGMSVSACGRCVRRTWTARGSEACASRAPPECCAGSVAE